MTLTFSVISVGS